MTFRTLPVAMPDISKISSAFADRTRAAVCGALMDGAAWTPTELAGFCSVSKSTMSEHLAVLKAVGVVGEVRQGRHRYFRLAGPEVASVIESLAAIAGANFPSPKNYNAHRANTEFAAGRTCYNHLAGELGVRLLQELSAHGYISAHLQVTEDGDELLRSWGIPAWTRPTACSTWRAVWGPRSALDYSRCRGLSEPTPTGVCASSQKDGQPSGPQDSPCPDRVGPVPHVRHSIHPPPPFRATPISGRVPTSINF